MLEPIILDNTERLIASGPYFKKTPMWTLMHYENPSVLFGQDLSPSGALCIYNEVLDILIFSAGAAVYRLQPDAFLAGGNAMALDTSLVVHQMAVEPGTGRVWGVVNNSSGNDGLYVRQASIGTPAWAKVVAAANGSALTIWKTTTGALWYHDATAGNWYLLSNGTAGSVTATQPAGLYIASTLVSYENVWNIDALLPAGGANSSAISAFSGGNSAENHPIPVLPPNATTFSSSFAVHDNSAAQSQATFKCLIPGETFAGTLFANQTSLYFSQNKTLRLSDTYTLFGMVSNLYDLVAINGGTTYNRLLPFAEGRAKASVALLNKQTNVCKHLGSFIIPYFVDTTVQPVSDLCSSASLMGGRLKNGNLDLAFKGGIGMTGGVQYSGLLWASIPISNLDF